jgi:hypothetical protein
MLFLQFIVLPHNYLLRNCYLQQILLKTDLIDELSIVSRHVKDYSSLQSTGKLFNRAIFARIKEVKMTSKDADTLISPLLSLSPTPPLILRDDLRIILIYIKDL